MATVTNAEVDQEFYDAHRDATGKLDPALVDPATGKPRKLTDSPGDKQFVQEWIKIRKHLQEIKNCAPPGGGAPIGAAVGTCPPPKKDPDAPPLELSKWNDGGPIQNSTNCYAYAMNSRTGHTVGKTPQPGVKSGNLPTSWSCSDYSASVLADGKPTTPGQPDSILPAPQCAYQKKNQLPPPKKKGYYLVALVMTSNATTVYDPAAGEVREADYHWFRQDDNGLWSQKQGTTPAKNTDESGNLITNPQTCDKKEKLGVTPVPGVGSVPEVLDYDVFCGYFYVKKGGADVQG
jgi:hypothetical protein